jgi:hypothetical protein
VPAAMKMTFFHFIASLNVDFLSSALIKMGLVRINLEICPFSTRLAATTTFF